MRSKKIPLRPGNAAHIAAVAARASLAALLVVAFCAAARAAGVFEKPRPDYAVDGAVATSEAKKFPGLLYTTLGKPMRVYDREKEKFVSFTLREISRIDVAVEEEHEEPFWYWKESGSDEKVFSGTSYPWRKYLTTVAFADGTTITGDLDALVYVEAPGGARTRHLLHKRQKGAQGQKPSDLVYVTSIVVTTGDRVEAPLVSPDAQ